jgi:opacity protein-like surface antigen
MLKKILTLSAISMLAANTAQAEHGFYKSGFQLGAHLGGSFGKGKFDTVYQDNAGDPLLPSSATAKKSSSLAGLSGGYMRVFHNGVTLGANVVVNMLFNQKMTANLTHSNIEVFRNSVKRNYSIMPSINLGKVFAGRYHAYLGLGASISRFEIEVFNCVDNKSTAKSSKTKVAFVPSVGLDYALNQHIALSANVSYEIFSNINHRFKGDLLPLFPTGHYDTRIKPKFITTRFGVTYKF